ncbi:TIM-barrel domain-containing protein [Sphingomonas sp. PAMC 26621]|uniref:TIM-barrel domain-containing protein n=1 Tax=Sphingomonas sp. PAMC 26621 TaxID=1112213 RepID=UPI00028A2F1D|nr:TIM-barrel domain-containing protein [Sphingomonas sp. PAMC 26621]
MTMFATTRRALLHSAALTSAGLAMGRALAGVRDSVPRIERQANGVVIYRDGNITDLRLPLAGIASVVKCSAANLALGGGFFAHDGASSPTVRFVEDAHVLRLMGEGIIVEIDKANGRLRFFDGAGTIRIAESVEPAPIPGVDAARRQGFTIGATERLHGLGQFRAPVAEYRDEDVFLAHANSDAINPFLTSTGGWGLLWDTGTAAHFRSRATAIGYHSVAGDLIRYHVCLGADMDAVIGRYRALTGAAALLPKWAYGYWQSKERYQTQAELTGVVDEYRRRGLPLDAIVLDWHYWGENDHFSGMTFDTKTFPDPSAMVRHVHASDAHVLISVWPAFGSATAIYQEMALAKHLFPLKHWSGGRVFDASSAPARDLYWQHVKRGLVDHGFDGLWTDGNEPEFQSTGERYGTAAAFAANGLSAAGPIAENLLTFSWYQSKGLSEGLERDVPSKRPVILSRSAYAGQQAFGAITWSGDIFASWGTLSAQILAAQQFAMAGIPWWTCDIGGFLVNHRYPRGLADPAYTELYVRWFQFGAFLPVFRAHGTHVPRELWQFGKPGTPVYDALEKALRLRYSLLPYHYSLAAEAALAGGTPLRALAMDFSDDVAARDHPAQFMVGRDLLVRVVDRPLEHSPENIQEFLPSRAVKGLNAPAAEIAFYEGSNFERRVSSRQTDELKMSWSGDLPTALAGKPYSIRWTGRLRAEESGTHRLVVQGKGAIRLSLAGRTVIDGIAEPAVADGANGAVSFREHDGDARYEVPLSLEAGQSYVFRLEQRQRTADVVSLWFEWITPSQVAKMAIPQSKVITVYLPAGQDWYDLTSEERHVGGRSITVPAPLDYVPVFARAGAILPMTPGIDRASVRPNVIELRVFAGRDGRFTLYEDGGDGDGYKHGAAARIPIRWHDAKRRLVVGPRTGTYPNMVSKIYFQAHLADGHGAQIVRKILFDGSEQSIEW